MVHSMFLGYEYIIIFATTCGHIFLLDMCDSRVGASCCGNACILLEFLVRVFEVYRRRSGMSSHGQSFPCAARERHGTVLQRAVAFDGVEDI